MEVSENGNIGMIRNQQTLIAVVSEISDTYGNMDSIPIEDKLMSDLLYGDNEKDKAKYIKRICDYKKYEKILEYETLNGQKNEYELLIVLGEQMKQACCGEEDIVAAKLDLQAAYMELDGEDFIRRAHEIVDPKIERNKKRMVKYADPKWKEAFDDLSRQFEVTPDAIKLTMLKSTDDELHEITEAIKSGKMPKIDRAKLKANGTLLRYNRADEEGKRRIKDEIMRSAQKSTEEAQSSIEE